MGKTALKGWVSVLPSTPAAQTALWQPRYDIPDEGADSIHKEPAVLLSFLKSSPVGKRVLPAP